MKDEMILFFELIIFAKKYSKQRNNVIFIFATEKNQRKNVNQLSKGFLINALRAISD